MHVRAAKWVAVKSVFAALCVTIGSCSPAADAPLALSEADFKGRWPFTVNEVVLDCGDGSSLYAVVDGTAYLLGGADGRSHAAREGDSITIRRKDPSSATFGVPIYVAITDAYQAGVERCRAAGQWLRD